MSLSSRVIGGNPVTVLPHPDSVISWHVMPGQHLSQDPPSARHSARLAAVLYLRAVHTLLRTYLSVAHLVAVVPSHVEPLGQAVHTLLRT